MAFKHKENSESSAPVFDESWWNSLLDTANKYQGIEKATTNHHPDNDEIEIDWELMEEYFHNDEVFVRSQVWSPTAYLNCLSTLRDLPP